jgi:mono/diheme cytochrome c family protein
MIWVKRFFYLVGGFILLLLVALAVVWIVTSIRMSKRYDVAARPVPVPTDSAGIARGRHLALAIGKCAECHGPYLGGQIIGDDFIFGRLVASNLTPGQGGRASLYDDPTLARAIRHGINQDGKPLRVMPSEAYQYFSDEDVGALVAYIRSLTPVDKDLPGTRIGPLARVLSLLTPFPLIPARVVDHGRVPPASMPEAATVEYGKYLADAGGCTGCHGPGLSGGAMGPGKPASNLTPAGIGTWTEADFFRALREGKRPVGADIDSLSMPWVAAGKMTDAEIHAVWLFLKSMPAKEFGNR